MFNKIYVKGKKFIKQNYINLIILVVMVFVGTYKLPYYVDATGGLLNTKDKVSVEDSYESKGSFNMAYVNEIRATIPIYILAKINPKWDIIKEEEVVYTNETLEEAKARGKLYVENMKDNATIYAFSRAGKEVTVSNTKVVIMYKDEKADTDLKIGDSVEKVNGIYVTDAKSLKDEVSKYNVGDKISFEVENNGKKYTRYGVIKDFDGIHLLGISMTEVSDIETAPKVKFNFKKNESGPSGGLMLTLTLYNYLTKEDISHGLKIAGTGTIESDGTIGEIGGIKYKLNGVVKEKADVFLVPKENYKEAMKYKKEYGYDIEIVSVETFDDALNYLKKKN